MFIVIVPLFYGYPLTYMLFTYKTQEESLLIILFSTGIRPNTIITMMVMELLSACTWILSIIFLLMWYFCTKHKSPYKIKADKTDGHAFWIDKNCDDYLRYVQR